MLFFMVAMNMQFVFNFFVIMTIPNENFRIINIIVHKGVNFIYRCHGSRFREWTRTMMVLELLKPLNSLNPT